MNCKPGDLAIYIGQHKVVFGVIVKCVRPMRWFDRFRPSYRIQLPAWRICPPIMFPDGRLSEFASDHCLRPIRDSDGTDEMIRIAGLPQKQQELLRIASATPKT